VICVVPHWVFHRGFTESIMKMVCNQKSARRRGATLVEFALMLVIFFMFLFGIFEYCRFLLVQHVGGVAARDAARYAAVNSGKDQAVFYTDPYNLGSITFPVTTGIVHPTQRLTYEPALASDRVKYKVDFIENYLKQRLGGIDGNIKDLVVRVYPADAASLYANPAVMLPKQNSTSWNNADFPGRIAVEIGGQYEPILPSFLFMGGITRINIVALVVVEG